MPAYLKLDYSDLILLKEKALGLLEDCHLCPRNCGVNRIAGETGYCRTGRKARIASYSPHFGEEAPLTGEYGSGTIFFSYCNLRCSFCQNYDISCNGQGSELEPEQIASIILVLANRYKCHNINFVTPTHVVPQIIEALVLAIEQGLDLPLLYNSSGYDSIETLQLLDGIFDIYMPDFKFWDHKMSEKYCKASDYREVAIEAVREMHRQVGDLVLDDKGIAARGILLRHLVMPNDVSSIENILRFIKNEISMDTYINIMGQYRPCGTANTDKMIGRRLTIKEYQDAILTARKIGLTRLDS